MDGEQKRGSQVSGLILPALFVLAVLVACTQGETGVEDYNRTLKRKSAVLDSIKTALTQGRERLVELKRREGSYLEQLEQIEKNMDNSRRYLAAVTEEIELVSRRIDTLGDSLASAQQRLETRRAVMAARLRGIYKAGRSYRVDAMGLLQMAVTSTDLTDLIHRVRYTRALNRYDRDLVDAIRATQERIRVHSDTLETKREVLLALKSDKESEQVKLVSEQESRRRTLEEVRAEKEAYVAMVKELEQAHTELNLIIKQLQAKRREAEAEAARGAQVAFAKRKGKLPWPVEGVVVRQFGKIVHPVYKTVTMNHGIDIQSVKGEKVLCVAPGRVDYVGWMRGYGKFVIVNHYDGFLTIYAHLGDIAVAQDQDLELGAVVGVVGETGSLSGPKLHFQIRRTGDPVDPTGWLAERVRS